MDRSRAEAPPRPFFPSWVWVFLLGIGMVAGGALATDGLAVLLLSLWGFRQGERWLWWTLLIGGTPGFLAGIGIHFVVGYTDWWHLLPAYGAVALFAVGLALSYPYLCASKKVEVCNETSTLFV